MKAKNIALICLAALSMNCAKGKIGGLIDGEATHNGGRVSTINTPIAKDTTKKPEYTLYALGTESGLKMMTKDNLYIAISYGWAWRKTGASYEESKKFNLGDGNHLALMDNDTLYSIYSDSVYFALTDAPIGFFKVKK
jgi:hypothetical protein